VLESTEDSHPIAPTPSPPQIRESLSVVEADTSITKRALVVNYFPTSDGQIDINITGDVDEPLAHIQQNTSNITEKLFSAIEASTTFLGSQNADAEPAIRMELVDTITHFAPVPTVQTERYPDYSLIVQENKICDYVNAKGVSEIFLWAYQGPNQEDGNPYLKIEESKMSSRMGDVSNSLRRGNLPLCDKPYVIYTLNYAQGLDAALHTWSHQVEFELRELLPDFMTSFHAPGRCGSVHTPPNSTQDYDYANKISSISDCMKFLGIGQEQPVSCEIWGCENQNEIVNAHAGYLVWLWQHLPGGQHTVRFQNRLLPNLWEIHGDFDQARLTMR